MTKRQARYRQTRARVTRERVTRERPASPYTVSTRPGRPGSVAVRPRDPDLLSRLAAEVALRTFPAAQIEAWQTEIFEQTLLLSRSIDRPNFTRVAEDDVARLIRMYDDRFFAGKILPAASAEGIRFGLSSRMTSNAGKMVVQYADASHRGSRQFELVLSSTLLFQTFEDVGDRSASLRPIEVTGRVCRNRLEAMQRVAEHELTHLVEMLIWDDGNCNETRFQSIANRYFGHTDYRHQLITQRERAAVRFDIRVGDLVCFNIDGQTKTGRVNRITRRATVLVPDRRGERFSDGKRYSRYYVPLERLRKTR